MKNGALIPTFMNTSYCIGVDFHHCFCTVLCVCSVKLYAVCVGVFSIFAVFNFAMCANNSIIYLLGLLNYSIHAFWIRLRSINEKHAVVMS